MNKDLRTFMGEARQLGPDHFVTVSRAVDPLYEPAMIQQKLAAAAAEHSSVERFESVLDFLPASPEASDRALARAETLLGRITVGSDGSTLAAWRAMASGWKRYVGITAVPSSRRRVTSPAACTAARASRDQGR